jgi:rare lipoprotein A
MKESPHNNNKGTVAFLPFEILPKSLRLCILLGSLILGFLGPSCAVIKAPYTVTKATLKTTYTLTKWTTKSALGTSKVIYKVGTFSFQVIQAPITWPLTHGEIDTIGGLPPKDAIQKGIVKRSPYTVNGKKYVPISLKQAQNYRETGIASWYGYETYQQNGGHMTANGEVFDPRGLTGAHKYLPLPTYVRVTNLVNNRSVIVRINDRGPFVSNRIIDLSLGAAQKLGYQDQGTAKVLVESINTSSG